MSVRGSRSGGLPDQTGFEQLEHQTGGHTFRLKNPNTEIGATGTVEADRVDALEPAGGLERGEWAELVYVHVQNHEVHRDQVGTTSDGQIRAYWELSFDDIMRTGNMSPDEVEKQQVDDELAVSRGTTTNSDDALVARDRIVPDWEVITRSETHYMQRLWEVSSGTGAGGHLGQQPGSTFINFRNEMGGGPVVSDEDELFQHFGFNLVGIGNDDNIVQHVSLKLGWDVFTVD